MTRRSLPSHGGVHSVTFDIECTRFVDVHDSLSSAPRVTLRSTADGSEMLSIWEPVAASRDAPWSQAAKAVHRGCRRRHGAACRGVHARRRWAVAAGGVLYGGPHVQTVTRSWATTVDMRAQLLRSRGFAVLKLDNRGSSRRGLAFEASLRVRMGTCELEDQAAGAAALVASGVADPARVGIYGWSYGGYVSALAALRMPSVFRAAVAGAPVTSWDGYDTHYTERYMGLPQSEAFAYAAASALRAEPGAPSSAPLLIIHHYRTAELT